MQTKVTLENGILLRIGVPSGNPPKENLPGAAPILINVSGILPIPDKTEVAARLGSKPHPMLIYCNGCGKHFDIVAAKGAREYRCPRCEKMQVFNLETLINQAMEQTQKMLRKKHGR
ncbi:MAG: hypothetical protein ACREFR_17810 [Limisphaerales bacterium]